MTNRMLCRRRGNSTIGIQSGMQTKTLIFLIMTWTMLLTAITTAHAQFKPHTTTSWYIFLTSDESDQTLNNWMYQTGFVAGQQDQALGGGQNSFAILDFGQPWQVGTTQGTWSFFTSGRFFSNSTIQQAVEEFAQGYYVGTSSDTTSQMHIAVGTNNAGSYTTYAHGQAWANMLKNIGAWLSANSAGSQTSVLAAIDIEPGYSSPATASNWVNGYTSAWISPYVLYNYGSANGCPLSGTSSTPGICSSGWNQENIWYVSWGAAPSFPFPEIYSTAGGNAKQWQQISLYSVLAHGGLMYIVGPLSESQACMQKNNCPGMDNTPDQAWSQLWSSLNGDSRTAESPTYSTDLKWRK